jgi:hypothetical protein
MSATFNIQPIGRFAGGSQPVKRPKVRGGGQKISVHRQFYIADMAGSWGTNNYGVDLTRKLGVCAFFLQ